METAPQRNKEEEMTFPKVALLVAVIPVAGSALAQDYSAQECIDANPDNRALAIVCAISRGVDNANQARYDLENGLRPPRTYEEQLLQHVIQQKQREERERETLYRRRSNPTRPFRSPSPAFIDPYMSEEARLCAEAAKLPPSARCPGGECLACR